MTIQQLEKLIDAGFTKEEIYTLAGETEGTHEQPGEQNQSNDENQTGSEEQSAAADQPETNNDTGNQNKPEDNAGAAAEARIAGIEKRIDDLIKAVQLSNLKKDRFDADPESLEDETDKIMKSIIRPETERGNKND